jgi:hypothetical protein
LIRPSFYYHNGAAPLAVDAVDDRVQRRCMGRPEGRPSLDGLMERG